MIIDTIQPIIYTTYGKSEMVDALIKYLASRIRDYEPCKNDDLDSRERMIRMVCWDWMPGGTTAANVAKQIEAALPLQRPDIITQVMDAQADLQTALGFLRLDIQNMADLDVDMERHDSYIEDRMAKSLARLHQLLDQLGNPMYKPATHPDVWEGPTK